MNEQAYINNIKEQIRNGMYNHLFMGRSNLVFLDIGANVGLVSIFAVPYCKHIVAVEPAPDTFRMLKENTNHYPTIECFNVALAPSNGETEFYINDVNFTASSTVNTYGTKIRVPCADLFTILGTVGWNVDVCKIDAEGAEGESLSYEQIYASRLMIKTYYIETHNCPKTGWEHKLGTIVGNLSRCGYSKMTIDGMSVTATRP